MTRLFSILSIGFALLITSSCTDWLDIEPESEVVLENFWQNESQVNEILAGCYRSMTEKSYVRRMLVWGELRSDNVTSGSNVPEDMYKILTVDITADNDYNKWGSIYTTINLCNTFLYYAPDVTAIDPNFTESELHALEAEVLTIRAISYFYLIRTFKEVPWLDTPSLDDTQDYSVAASSGAEILEHLVEDLKTALKYARDKFETNSYNKGRITKNAVRALLADIYLWQENFDGCIQMCDEILYDNLQGLELVKGENVLEDVFYNGNSTESIFELQFDDDLQFNEVLKDYLGYYGNPFGQWSFPQVLINGISSPFGYWVGNDQESKEDIRKKDFLLHTNISDKYYVFKYAGALRTENSAGYSSYIYRNTTANWIIYRLSEIILMKAESLIQQGNYASALELINITYLRSNTELKEDDGLSIDNYNTKADMESLLLRERQREFMFEGKRWFTLMRLALRAEDTSPLLGYVMKKYSGTASVQASKMSVMDALYLPFHTDELKANPKLEQNPFYELTVKE
jgi:hypothetical protein